LIVTAEGVENEEQVILLRAAGCHEFQGFFFAKPEPAAAISNRLEGERALGRPPLVQRA
jgi:EAL domain-containing protein (putative c-di-GMP-specific phosphodiesterase class I)